MTNVTLIGNQDPQKDPQAKKLQYLYNSLYCEWSGFLFFSLFFFFLEKNSDCLSDHKR